MTRYNPYEDWYGDGPDTSGLWWSSFQRALTSPRGQKLLREIETALLALPEKKLIMGSVSDGTAVCAVGALAAYRQVQAGATWADAFIRLHHEHGADAGEDQSIEETVSVGESLGMARTIAWELAHDNDHRYGWLSGEGRYEHVLTWVRSNLTHSTATVS